MSRWISVEFEMTDEDELLRSVPCEIRLARLRTAETSVEPDVVIGPGKGAIAGLAGVEGACAWALALLALLTLLIAELRVSFSSGLIGVDTVFLDPINGLNRTHASASSKRRSNSSK